MKEEEALCFTTYILSIDCFILLCLLHLVCRVLSHTGLFRDSTPYRNKHLAIPRAWRPVLPSVLE